MSIDLFCAIMRPSSTNERIETGILRILRWFSRIYKKGKRYKANKTGERADPWPTPTFTLNVGDGKPFHI